MILVKYIWKPVLTVLLFVYLGELKGQNSAFEPEAWVGYNASIRLGERFAMWNDFHFIPQNFWINRHGLTYKVSHHAKLTVGYALVATATSFTEKLQRYEHRPWAQYELIKPFDEKNSWRARVRYDYRIRRALGDGEFADGWAAYNRLRLMLSTSHQIKQYANGRKLHLNLLNEILVNQGGAIDGGVAIDQNRSYILLGMDFTDLRVFFGPHLRLIPNSTGGLDYRGGLTLWFIQKFDWPKWPAP